MNPISVPGRRPGVGIPRSLTLAFGLPAAVFPSTRAAEKPSIEPYGFVRPDEVLDDSRLLLSIGSASTPFRKEL